MLHIGHNEIWISILEEIEKKACKYAYDVKNCRLQYFSSVPCFCYLLLCLVFFECLCKMHNDVVIIILFVLSFVNILV